MSEHRYYEFRAIDEPLSDEEQSELREISSRAEITSTSFINEYNWGDLSASPRRLVERYFDAYLHITNYGLREVMFRLPAGVLDVQQARRYEYRDGLQISETDTHHIVEFSPLMEDRGREYWWEDQVLLSSMLPLRDRLARGDFRALYIGWLFGALYTWMDEEATEPPVPAGLDELDEPLAALVQFLTLEPCDLEAAAEASPAVSPLGMDVELRRWLADQSDDRKLDWLLQFIQEDDGMLAATIRRRFANEQNRVLPGQPVETDEPRTVADLHDCAESCREERRAREREQKRREEERKRREQQRKRNAYLDRIAGQQEKWWSEVEELVADSYQAKDYDKAVSLIVDLRDLAQRDGDPEDFRRRLADFRDRYGRRRTLMERLDDRGLGVEEDGGSMPG